MGDLRKFLKKCAVETDIDLTVAAELMGVNYKSLYSRILSGRLHIQELLQLSDIYRFTLEEMKREIDYKKHNESKSE